MRTDIKGEGSQGEKTGVNGDVLMLSCSGEEEAGLGAGRGAESRSPAALGSV